MILAMLVTGAKGRELYRFEALLSSLSDCLIYSAQRRDMNVICQLGMRQSKLWLSQLLTQKHNLSEFAN